MAPGTHALRPHETTLVIQATIEDLDPQQVLARDLLVEYKLESFEAATYFVRNLAYEGASVLKAVLTSALDSVIAYRQFCREFT